MNKDDFMIEGATISIKEYTGTISPDGVRHYNWVTLLEVHRKNSFLLTANSDMRTFMSKILKAVSN